MLKRHLPLILSSILLTSVAFITIQLALSIRTVDLNEVGLHIRNGKYLKTLQPGQHLQIPVIDGIKIVEAKNIYREDFGFEVVTGEDKNTYAVETGDSYFVTADLKVITIKWSLDYKISDPVKYAYTVQDQTEIVRTIALSAVSEITGNYLFDEILTVKREEIMETARVQITEELERINSGIRINQVQLKEIMPPERIKGALDDIYKAQQEKEAAKYR